MGIYLKILLFVVCIRILTYFFRNQFKKNWLIHYIHDKSLYETSKKYLKGSLIDIGCGEKPYEKLLKKFIDSHIGLDHIETFHDKSNIDLFGTAYEIPVEDNNFDSAICTAVLEHLEEPELALRECYRVLNKGGVAIYTVPFIWHVHEAPRDFYRFSKYGLKYLFNKVGFEILEIKALSGFWVTFGQLFVYKIYGYNKGIIKLTQIIPLLGFIIQRVSYILDKLEKKEKWTWMYQIVIKKK